jgi:hypothetical protein
MTLHPRLGALALALCLPSLAACPFFQELESKEGATDSDGESDGGSTDASSTTSDGSTATSEASAAPCTVEADDRCIHQDLVQRCDPRTGDVSLLDCAPQCGALTNLSCLDAGQGTHACYCINPGEQKVWSCTEIESCVLGCGTIACEDDCFRRSDDLTARMFGALLHCAEAACVEVCAADVSACIACRATALEGRTGGCSVERSLCDADRGDEPTWP